MLNCHFSFVCLLNVPSKQNINILGGDLTELRGIVSFQVKIMQIKYLINSITLVESFNHNFAFCSIISVATFKHTCLTVSQQNYDAVKERRNTLLHALFILSFLILFPILISLSHLQSQHQLNNFQNRFSLAKFLRRL